MFIYFCHFRHERIMVTPHNYEVGYMSHVNAVHERVHVFQFLSISAIKTSEIWSPYFKRLHVNIL